MNIYINCILLFSVIIILFYIIDKYIENVVINDTFKNSIDSTNNNKLNGISNKNVEGAQPNSSGSGWNLLSTNNEVEVIEHATTNKLTSKDDFIIPIMKSNNQDNFVASVSSSLNNNNPAYAAFNRSTDSTKYINTKHNYDKKSGLYKGSFKSPDKNFKEVKGVKGEWIKINFPNNNKNIVTSYTIKGNNNIYRAPNTFYIFGLLNDKWIQLDYQKNQIFTENELKTYKLNNNKSTYKSYCMLATVVGTPDLSKKPVNEEGRVSLSFKEWNLMHLTTITTSTAPDNNDQNQNCSIDNIGNICSTQDGFGTINKYCECIINKTEDLSEEEENNNDENKCKNVIDNMLKMGKLQLPGLNKNIFNQLEEDVLQEEENIDNDKNFDQNINDNNIDFNGLMMTPCLYKNEDFDTWCRYFNSDKIPAGYNKNSLGSAKVLPGKLGTCFTNGNPDPNKARAICGYNSMQTLSKLGPVNNIIGYNKFTDCLPLNSTNFKSECSNILKTNISNSSAVEIMGYDCNPLYARAKCIYLKDKGNMFNDKSLKCPCS